MDPATRLGPMIERPHLDKVLAYIEAGRDEGARVVAGGGRTLEATGGYFVAPTIFDDVAQLDEDRARGDLRAGDLDDPVRLRGRGRARSPTRRRYGLAASVYTTDLDAAFRVARSLRAGTVGVNAYSEGDITTPFGGYKESGFGGRDKGLEAFEQYTEKKTIWFTLRG